MKSLFNKISDMSIKMKMLMGFGAMMLVLALIAAQTMLSLLGIKDSVKEVVDEHQVAVINAMKLSKTIEISLSGLGLYLLSKEETYKDNFTSGILNADQLIKDLKNKHIIKTHADNAALVNKIDKDFNSFKSFQETLLVLAVDSQKNFPGMSNSTQFINPLSQVMLQNFEEMIRSEEDRDNRENGIELLNDLQNMRYSWVRLMNGIRAYLGFRNATALNEIKNYRDNFKKQFAAIDKKYSNKMTLEQEDAMVTLHTNYDTFPDKLNEVINLHGSDEWRQDAYLIRSKLGPILSRLNNSLNQLTQNLTADITRISADLVDNADNTITSILVYSAIAMAGVALLAYLLLTGIINPMTLAVNTGITSIKKVMENFSSDNDKAFEDNFGDSDDTINNVSRRPSTS